MTRLNYIMAITQRFVWLDVFTDTPLTGNPLAVFPEADGLDERAMQAIARELNLSETTFVVSPREHRATRRLRCFSPSAEVFGAGHNALGAWWALVAGGHLPLQTSGMSGRNLVNRYYQSTSPSTRAVSADTSSAVGSQRRATGSSSSKATK